MNYIYLDNNASTMIDPKVFDKMSPYLKDHYGNPNSTHYFGEMTHEGLNVASDQFYKYLNIGEEDTFVVTSCATESINTVHKSILFDFLNSKNKNKSKNKIITTSFEHPASAKSLEYLKNFGIEIIELPIKNDSISIDDFKEVFNSEEILLVSLIYAHNETGVILPIKDLAKIIHNSDVPIHIDATQAIGKIDVDVQDLNIDFLSCSAHKIHGPKGVGGLYIKQNRIITPLLHGGTQMGGFRAGTLNTAGIIGFGEALELAAESLNFFNTEILSLRQHLEEFLLTLPDSTIHGYSSDRIANTIFVTTPTIDSDYMVWYLNKNNISISSGSACSSQQLKKTTQKTPGVRFSLSRFTTKSEIDKTIECIKKLL